MIGAEFIIHGSQQPAHQIVVDKNFPGMSAVPDDFGPLEEWYSLEGFSAQPARAAGAGYFVHEKGWEIIGALMIVRIILPPGRGNMARAGFFTPAWDIGTTSGPIPVFPIGAD
jgi:hypothetical protein